MGIFKKIFGDYSEKEVKRVMPIVEKINSLEEEISKLTDTQLKAKTADFKVRFQDGETLDDLLPEAFAVVREASKRVLGMRHFDVQLIRRNNITPRKNCRNENRRRKNLNRNYAYLLKCLNRKRGTYNYC